MLILPGMGYETLMDMTGPRFWEWHEIALQKYGEIRGVNG